MRPLLPFRFLLLALFTLAVGIPALPVALLLPGRDRKGKLFRLVSKLYAPVALALFGVRAEGRGTGNIDPGRPYVFMANHVSHVDSPAIALVVPQPLHWVFKKELSRIPVFGWFLRSCGQIMVDRGDTEQARAVLAEAVGGLGGNHSIMIFPEGTRSRDGTLQPLRKGGFWIALRAGLPIVPLRVSGTRAIAPSGSLDVRPGTAFVEICPPVPVEGLGPDDLPVLMERVRDALGSGTTRPG